MKKIKTLILGGGISGLATQYFLKKESLILEQENFSGGLCHSFVIDGFLFDTFVHLSFTKEKEVIELFDQSIESILHKPLAFNYYHKHWLRHPAQNNIYPLSTQEKVDIIEDVINRKSLKVENYEDWLRAQYGNYFAEHFPMAYAKKYWSVEAKDLETKWVGNRLYQPPISEILKGAFEEDQVNRYYANEMRYPKEGGYQSYLKNLIIPEKINYDSEVNFIDPTEKIVKTKSGEIFHYENLVSTLPLPKLCEIIKDVPEEIIDCSKKLHCTSGIIVSLGFNRGDIPKHLWYYIYDEDILPARVYSPSLKSPKNAPEGCSSIQGEYYFSDLNPLTYSLDEVLEKTIEKLSEVMDFKEDEIVVKDVRKIEYANVIFTHDIYENREKIHIYLKNIGIDYAGRFGEWDYLWSDQSFLSGKNMAEKINLR